MQKTELPGNDKKYDLENIAALEEITAETNKVTTAETNKETTEENIDETNKKITQKNTLKGKTICFLGSSVTKGEASEGISFADYIGKRNRCTIIKEAVSGTTLVNEGPDSYVDRINMIDKNSKIDLFVCQLSTNDASQKKALGDISDGNETNSFDVTTITGAIEHITKYAMDTWKCPVVFFTNVMYDSLEYQNMVTRLYELQKKWGIGIIDLWGDTEINGINSEKYYLYMADAIHPTKAGYLEWWTPKMEKYLKWWLSETK